MAERMTGGQAVVRALAEHGVEVAFGIPGVHTLALYDALIDSPIRHILGRHEQGVGFMADGYARASGKPGVALVITGPGVTNVATAVGEAYTDSSPVLVVASAEDQRWAGKMMGHYHDIRDQTEAIRPVTASQAQATAVGEVAPAIGAAFARMATARPRRSTSRSRATCWRPRRRSPSPIRSSPSGPARPPSRSPAPSRRSPRRSAWSSSPAAARRRPSRRGHRRHRRAARRAGDHLPDGQRGRPGGPPLRARQPLGPGNAVDAMLRKADAVLVFGTKLGGAETEDGAMRLPATLIRIDIDPEEVERNYRPSRAIVADARKTAEALNEALAAAGVSNDGWSPEEIATARAKALETAFGGENAAYLAALRRAIPRDGILVNDTTMMSYAAAKFFPAYAPRTFLVPAGYLTLGFSLPAAIGAKIAQPDKVVVSIVGDGGFQFTMHELATAKQFGIGLPIVIFNDSTYTAVKMDQAMRYDRRYIAVDLVNPDFLKLAAAYGIPGVRANSPAELEAAVIEASARNVPDDHRHADRVDVLTESRSREVGEVEKTDGETRVVSRESSSKS